MATKKRLADLVREEVEKQADSSETSAKASAPKKAKTQPTQSTVTKPTSKTATAKKSSAKSTTAKASTAKDTKNAKAQGDEIKALKAQINQLKKDNKILQGNEAKLTNQIQTLEATLADYKQHLQGMKTLETKNKTLASKLDEVKQDALKLAQENQKLLDKIETAATKQSQTAKPVHAQVTQGHAIQRRTARPRPYKPPAKKPFSRPVVPARMPLPQQQNSDEFETWCYD